MCAVKFSDQELQEYYDRIVPLTAYLPDELRCVCALMDAYRRFRMTDGERAPRVREVIQILTASEMRPALHGWYRHCDQQGEMNPAATEFRRTLSRLVGENL